MTRSAHPRRVQSDRRREIIVHSSLAELVTAAARLVATAAVDATASRRRFTIALSGGGTPKPLYALLARDYADTMPWSESQVCFGDERCVPPHNPASNFRLAWTTLLEKVPIVEQHVHRIIGELGADAAARDYDARMRRLFPDPDAPTLDVALMGVGTDGHTASLFPGEPALEEQRRLVAPAAAPDESKVRERVTMTLPMLNRARLVLFVVAGREKAAVVSTIRSGSGGDLPAGQVYGVERTVWLVDGEAGGG